jgi:hypothetical protein
MDIFAAKIPIRLAGTFSARLVASLHHQVSHVVVAGLDSGFTPAA